MYRVLQAVYRSVIPVRVRSWFWHNRNHGLGRALGALKTRIAESSPHDQVYNDEYYKFVDQSASQAAPAMVTSMVRDLALASVVDVGCGTGSLLAEFQRRGIRVEGFERSVRGAEMCRQKGIPVQSVDFESDKLPTTRADVATSMEVAEHLPPHIADPFVQFLTTLADVVVITAATPGQGGTDHVNEQPNEYWIGKFQNHGFALDETLTHRWRQEWSGSGIATWYSRNVLVFRSIARTALPST